MWEANARGELPMGVRRSGGEPEARVPSPDETSGASEVLNSDEDAGSPEGLSNPDEVENRPGQEGTSGLSASEGLPVVLFYGNGGVKGRSDGQAGFDLHAGVQWSPFRRLSWDLSVARGAAMPTLQSLYWQSAGYAGNEGLGAEQTEQIVSEMAYRLGASWEAGLRAGWRSTDQAALLEEIPGGVDGTGEPLPSTWTFVEADPYETRFGSAWLGLDARHWEGEMSATIREVTSSSGQSVVQSMMEGDPPLWLKGELFWKGNVFSSAAYVKGGLRGMWSPGGYRPAQFHVPMNVWQSGGTGDVLGDFSRLDLEISSRIRWFMLLLRYENLLDGVTQPGYFEADRYPMPGRRMIVSLRVLFTN